MSQHRIYLYPKEIGIVVFRSKQSLGSLLVVALTALVILSAFFSDQDVFYFLCRHVHILGQDVGEMSG